jgi:hypothetical protein
LRFRVWLHLPISYRRSLPLAGVELFPCGYSGAEQDSGILCVGASAFSVFGFLQALQDLRCS